MWWPSSSTSSRRWSARGRAVNLNSRESDLRQSQGCKSVSERAHAWELGCAREREREREWERARARARSRARKSDDMNTMVVVKKNMGVCASSRVAVS